MFMIRYRTPSKKTILKELKEALDRNNVLREQVAHLTAGFGGDHQVFPNTARPDGLLLSTMNSWSLGSMNIPECTPSEGEVEVDKRAFEYWKDILMSSLQLANATDEQVKFGVFKIKSGPKLREILLTTTTRPGMPDERIAPFSNALARLDEYYGSRAYTLSQRGKMMMMCQSASEDSIAFVRRVTSAAKLCNYGPDEEMEAVVRVITQRASDARVRVLANRNWMKQGTMKDLIDQIRDREIEKANEEEFQRAQVRREAPLVAAVSHENHDVYSRRPAFGSYERGRGFPRAFRGDGVGGRGFSRGNYRPQLSSNCWRCGSIYHQASDCFAIRKECRVCRKFGHIARVCPTNQPGSSREQRRPLKRRADEEESSGERKVAAIECAKIEPNADLQVTENDESLE